MKAISQSRRGIHLFYTTLVALAVIRVSLSFVQVPTGVEAFANILMTELFLGAPLLALCFAAQEEWSPKTGLKFLISGVLLQGSCILIGHYLIHQNGFAESVVNAVGQIGLPMWCVGLGALLSALIKDRNLILPIAIFLVFMDLYLVFSPVGVTRYVLAYMPSVPSAVGSQVPRIAPQTSNHGRISPGFFAGPADFMFLAMFLITLFRFNMKHRLTIIVVLPTLIAYMLAVGLLRLSLPALVPIGLGVLIANWKEFKLTRDEMVSTGAVTVICIALFTWSMFQKPKVQIVGPSKTADAPASPTLPNSP